MTKVTWLDKLKHLVKFELKINAPLVDNRKFVIINRNNTTNELTVTDNSEKQVTYLNLNSLTDTQKEMLKPILREYIDNENKLLQVETAELLENLNAYKKDKTDQQILTFFQGIIPKEDFEALQASLYLRTVFKQGKNIIKLKRDIRNAFGTRGNNIANLCSAGYFEEFLIPIYNATKDNENKFKELYELIVNNVVLAIFVHRDMSLEEISSQIIKKAEISKKYGLGVIHIHGIGESNVAKIKNCLTQKENNFTAFLEKSVFEKDNILIIELILN